MIKYRGDRLWAKITLGVASILWGFLVAFVAVKVTEHLTGWFVTPLRILIFLFGFISLDIGIRKSEKTEGEEL